VRHNVSCYVAIRSAPGSPNSSVGDIMLEGVGGNEVAAGIKNVRPVMSPATTQRLVQLSNDLSVSRSAPVSPQGLCHYCAVVICLVLLICAIVG